jgi:hypothetical protein
MISYFTYYLLEIITGASWWMITKAYNGLYYIYYYNSDGSSSKIEISKDMAITLKNTKLIDTLVEKNKKQEEIITKLHSKIEILNNYFNNEVVEK